MTPEEMMTKYGIEHPVCGFDHLAGWMPLIENLIQELIALGWDKQLDQVKEKFGGLRFYIGLETQEMTDAIDRVERQSLSICDTCGEPGQCRALGWVRTLCDKCHTDRMKP